MNAKVEFDFAKLTKADQKSYLLMTGYEKNQFEKTWSQIETQKLRLAQQKQAAKEREAREKTCLAERERKTRTRRLIQRGAILESYIRNPMDFSNDEIKEIVAKTMNTDYMRSYVEKVRARHSGAETEEPAGTPWMPENEGQVTQA